MSRPAVFHPGDDYPAYWTWEGRLVIPDSIFRRLMGSGLFTTDYVESCIESALAQWAGYSAHFEAADALKVSGPKEVGSEATSPTRSTVLDPSIDPPSHG